MDDQPEAKTPLQEAVARETEALRVALSAQDELVFPVLKFHLLTEQLLERIITAKLPNGARLLKMGRFLYVNKLLVVDALGVVDRSVIGALEQVNELRNGLAHKAHDHVTRADIEAIASHITWPLEVGSPPVSEHLVSLGMWIVFSQVYSPLMAATLEAEGIS